MTEEIRALRAMVEDVTMPVEYRKQAAARLAELCPAPEDGVAEMLRLAGAEAATAIAEFYREGE